MSSSSTAYDAFRTKFEAWWRKTQALRSSWNREAANADPELELDHLIDYVWPVATAAAHAETRFDYSRIAREYLEDLSRVRSLLLRSSVEATAQGAYSGYLDEFRDLLASMESLPVPAEGHLGFRRCALRSFSFLTEQLDYGVSESSPVSVRFDSRLMYVSLTYSPKCPMESVLVGRREDGETPLAGFILDDFAFVGGLGVLFDYRRFDLEDKVGVAAFLDEAALIVRQNGISLLKGEDGAFRYFRAKSDEREDLCSEIMERSLRQRH